MKRVREVRSGRVVLGTFVHRIRYCVAAQPTSQRWTSHGCRCHAYLLSVLSKESWGLPNSGKTRFSSGSDASTPNPIYTELVSTAPNVAGNHVAVEKVGNHTSAPVQNIGHLLQGSSRAFCSHVLKYGFLTINGRTGGWRVEASMTLARSAVANIPRERIGAARAQTIIQTKG